jgi:hypothetical protein
VLWLCSLILAVDLALGLHIKGVTALYVTTAHRTAGFRDICNITVTKLQETFIRPHECISKNDTADGLTQASQV